MCRDGSQNASLSNKPVARYCQALSGAAYYRAVKPGLRCARGSCEMNRCQRSTLPCNLLLGPDAIGRSHIESNNGARGCPFNNSGCFAVIPGETDRVIRRSASGRIGQCCRCGQLRCVSPGGNDRSIRHRTAIYCDRTRNIMRKRWQGERRRPRAQYERNGYQQDTESFHYIYHLL